MTCVDQDDRAEEDIRAVRDQLEFLRNHAGYPGMFRAALEGLEAIEIAIGRLAGRVDAQAGSIRELGRQIASRDEAIKLQAGKIGQLEDQVDCKERQIQQRDDDIGSLGTAVLEHHSRAERLARELREGAVDFYTVLAHRLQMARGDAKKWWLEQAWGVDKTRETLLHAYGGGRVDREARERISNLEDRVEDLEDERDERDAGGEKIVRFYLPCRYYQERKRPNGMARHIAVGVLADAFGLRHQTIERLMDLHREGFQIYCTQPEFARFIIYRADRGQCVNGIQDLCATLVNSVPDAVPNSRLVSRGLA